jgi:hypothetical protein
MSATLTFPGLASLKRQIAALPKILTEDGTRVVLRAAAALEGAVRADLAGHRVTGNLLKGIRTVEKSHADLGMVIAQVRSNAHHAHLAERGTAPRMTKKLKQHRGAARGLFTFAKLTPGVRAAMYDDIKRMLERNGLQVTGDAGPHA